MATADSSNAFQFVFDAAQLKKLMSQNPDRVVFTVSVEQAITRTGKKVGALKILAKGTFKKKKMATRDEGTPGCPVPPCKAE